MDRRYRTLADSNGHELYVEMGDDGRVLGVAAYGGEMLMIDFCPTCGETIAAGSPATTGATVAPPTPSPLDSRSRSCRDSDGPEVVSGALSRWVAWPSERRWM